MQIFVDTAFVFPLFVYFKSVCNAHSAITLNRIYRYWKHKKSFNSISFIVPLLINLTESCIAKGIQQIISEILQRESNQHEKKNRQEMEAYYRMNIKLNVNDVTKCCHWHNQHKCTFKKDNERIKKQQKP